MRIGIDARFFGTIGKGLGRYTQKLIENLESIDSINEYFIFLRKENFDEYLPKNPRFKKVLANFRWYTISEQINMPRLLNKYNLDLVHFPHFNVPLFYRKNFIITIHDLILIHYPTVRGTTLNPLFYWLKYAAYKIVIKSAIRRAKKIIAVSNFTKNDILKHYKIPENKIIATYEACDFPGDIKGAGDDSILKKYGLPAGRHGIIKPCLPAGKPYILYVGNAYPHKNLEALVLGFKEFRRSLEYQLVLVGKEDYFYRQLRNFAENNNVTNVIFTGFIPDSELDFIYRNAKMYIFPSLYEGFGLPPLEAMARGVPVASSDHDCMKEILEDSAYYFDAIYVEKIAEAIKILINDNNLRAKLIIKGFERVKKFSWEKMAGETLKIYNEALKR